MFTINSKFKPKTTFRMRIGITSFEVNPQSVMTIRALDKEHDKVYIEFDPCLGDWEDIYWVKHNFEAIT